MAGWPLALITSDGKCGGSYLIDHFLSVIDRDVTVVRIAESKADELSAMQEIIRGIGFDPSGLSLSDLENVVKLFLDFQERHNSRTELCVEETQDCNGWLLHTIDRILDMRPRNSRGLMVLLSGRMVASEVRQKWLLNSIATSPKLRIQLAPFTLAETREFLRWRVKSAGMSAIAEVFEFDAITRIHELTDGSTDEVSKLIASCLHLAAKENACPVTVDLVNRTNMPINEQETAQAPHLGAIEHLRALMGYSSIYAI